MNLMKIINLYKFLEQTADVISQKAKTVKFMIFSTNLFAKFCFVAIFLKKKAFF